jgi:F-type H+-transporting ATPase subunit gamma
VKKVLIIAVTSNRGLAGAFNSSIVKELNHKISTTPVEVEVLTIGKKFSMLLKKQNGI